MFATITIAKEPVGKTYFELVRFAARVGGSFTLIWRDGLASDPVTDALLHALNPDLIDEKRTGAWPGTELLADEAVMRSFRISDRSLTVLTAVNGLYSWRSPSRPEDLAFWTLAGVPWLGSIAHEEDAFIYRDAVDVDALLSAVPDLSLEHGVASANALTPPAR